MFRISAVFCLLTLCCPLFMRAQENHYITGSDTLHYTYTPMPQTTVVKRPSLFRRIINYFGQSTTDRTFEKKIDITYAGGPSYSKNTSLGLGVLAAGLYRIDRTDSLTSPSDISLFGNVSITGFYAVGITGNTNFTGNRQRIDYTISFQSAPQSFWGIGYNAGCYNPESTYKENRYLVQVRYRHQIMPHTYLGGIIRFEHAKGEDFSKPEYLLGEKTHYTQTGIGLFVEYDSRDFAPNPYKGMYISLQDIGFNRKLGNCGKTLSRITFTADFYQRVWPTGILAFDLYGEFNSTGTPWPMLARMGGTQRMRGYYQGRYTDDDLLTVQMELRQRIWRRIGGVVWCGAGNVFPAINKYNWNQTLPNYGIGLRWELKQRINVRLDYGFGKKTSGFMLNVNEAF